MDDSLVLACAEDVIVLPPVFESPEEDEEENVEESGMAVLKVLAPSMTTYLVRIRNEKSCSLHFKFDTQKSTRQQDPSPRSQGEDLEATQALEKRLSVLTAPFL